MLIKTKDQRNEISISTKSYDNTMKFKVLVRTKNSSGRKKILHMYIFITNYTKKSSFCVLTISFKHQSMRNKTECEFTYNMYCVHD